MDLRKFRARFFAGASASFVLTMSVGLAARAADATPVKHLFMMKDQARLVADVYSPPGRAKHPGVILLHQLGESNQSMTPLVKPLLSAGFVVINVDMRGHGNSTGRGKIQIWFRDFTNKDWALLTSDLSQLAVDAAKQLPNLDGNNLAVVGASIGANAALVEAATDTKMKAVVAISPGLNFHDVAPAASMPALKRIPVWLIAAKPDRYSIDSATKLSKMDQGSDLKILESGGHGYQILITNRELTSDIATWLHKAMP